MFQSGVEIEESQVFLQDSEGIGPATLDGDVDIGRDLGNDMAMSSLQADVPIDQSIRSEIFHPSDLEFKAFRRTHLTAGFHGEKTLRPKPHEQPISFHQVHRRRS